MKNKQVRKITKGLKGTYSQPADVFVSTTWDCKKAVKGSFKK